MPSVFPEHGRDPSELESLLADWQTGDIDWRGGQAFSLVYNADDPVLEALQHRVADRFLHENALNPFVYPSLVRMDHEVVAVAAELFGTEPLAGTVTVPLGPVRANMPEVSASATLISSFKGSGR